MNNNFSFSIYMISFTQGIDDYDFFAMVDINYDYEFHQNLKALMRKISFSDFVKKNIFEKNLLYMYENFSKFPGIHKIFTCIGDKKFEFEMRILICKKN